MKKQIQLKNAIASVGASLADSRLRRGILLLLLGISCALTPAARALLPPPPPDGGYPGGNTAEGTASLFNLTTGFNNAAVGDAALFNLTSGSGNTAIGYFALFSDTTGFENTATGFFALTNTTGSNNTANGAEALLTNTTGDDNTATGVSALRSNTTGFGNTAIGWRAAYSNTDGRGNSVTGVNGLFHNTTGSLNTANGLQALLFNTTGNSNIALGVSAGQNLTTGSNNIDIGNLGVGGESNTIRIGTDREQTATFIAGISLSPVANCLAVMVDSQGKLGTNCSSERFKTLIKPMDKASESILALKPVTFRYKKELDPKAVPQFGLVAEQVEKVNPDLVARDEEGKAYTVRYDAVNAMLLNEFLKEHHTVQELKEEIADLTATVKAQAAQIQQVSDQLGTQAPAPRVVADN